MPIEYRIDPVHRLIVSRAWGAVTEAELNAHYEQIAGDPRFDPTFQQIADAREVTDATGVRGDMPRRARRRPFAPGVRRALVTRPGFLFGLARQHTSYAAAQGDRTEAFASVAEAEAWLGLPAGASGLPADGEQLQRV